MRKSVVVTAAIPFRLTVGVKRSSDPLGDGAASTKHRDDIIGKDCDILNARHFMQTKPNDSLLLCL